MLSHDIDIRRVDRSFDPILRNLWDHYVYDMAEWFMLETDEDGRYPYAGEKLWDEGVDVYVAYRGRVPVGFGVVGSAAAHIGEPSAKDLHEFFVVRRHRRSGTGRALASHIWEAYPGPWLVRVYQGNLPALPFWRDAIREFTDGQFREEVRSLQDRAWSYFTFDSAGGS